MLPKSENKKKRNNQLKLPDNEPYLASSKRAGSWGEAGKTVNGKKGKKQGAPNLAPSLFLISAFLRGAPKRLVISFATALTLLVNFGKFQIELF